MGVYKERVQYKEVFCQNICASEYFALQYSPLDPLDLIFLTLLTNKSCYF